VEAEILEEVWPAGGPRALAPQLEAVRQLVYELSTRLPTESGAPQLAEAVAQMSDPSSIVDLVGAAVVSDPESRQKVLEELDVARRLEYVLEEVAGVVLVLSKEEPAGLARRSGSAQPPRPRSARPRST
jgi:hypothetical protein